MAPNLEDNLAYQEIAYIQNNYYYDFIYENLIETATGLVAIYSKDRWLTEIEPGLLVFVSCAVIRQVFIAMESDDYDH